MQRKRVLQGGWVEGGGGRELRYLEDAWAQMTYLKAGTSDLQNPNPKSRPKIKTLYNVRYCNDSHIMSKSQQAVQASRGGVEEHTKVEGGDDGERWRRALGRAKGALATLGACEGATWGGDMSMGRERAGAETRLGLGLGHDETPTLDAVNPHSKCPS